MTYQEYAELFLSLYGRDVLMWVCIIFLISWIDEITDPFRRK